MLEASIALWLGLLNNSLHRTFDRSKPEDRAISHVCLDPGQDSVEILQSPCAEMRTQTYFPSCWNGRDLDSADHKSHVSICPISSVQLAHTNLMQQMAFPAIGDYNGGVCPKSHPVAIVSVFTEFFYNTRQVKDFNRWVYAEGDTIGYGLRKFPTDYNSTCSPA